MDTLEERIAARLNETMQRVAGAPGAGVDCGLAYVEGWMGGEGKIVLTVEEVAKIAAQEAQAGR